MSWEVLIYEKYENEYGFVERDDMTDPRVPTIERKDDRKLRIFAWGVTSTNGLTAKSSDVSKFYTHVHTENDVRQLNGLDHEI